MALWYVMFMVQLTSLVKWHYCPSSRLHVPQPAPGENRRPLGQYRLISQSWPFQCLPTLCVNRYICRLCKDFTHFLTCTSNSFSLVGTLNSGNYNLFVKLSYDTFLSKPKVECRARHASQLRLSHVYNFQILNSTSHIRIFKTLDAPVKTSGQLVRNRNDNFRSKKSKERI